MSMRKPFAAAAALTAAFAIGATATTTSAATMPATPTAATELPADAACPTWYGRHNPADGACLAWCGTPAVAPCSAPDTTSALAAVGVGARSPQARR
jgi:hypothetical protein